jgi:hypothetical protein
MILLTLLQQKIAFVGMLALWRIFLGAGGGLKSKSTDRECLPFFGVDGGTTVSLSVETISSETVRLLKKCVLGAILLELESCKSIALMFVGD